MNACVVDWNLVGIWAQVVVVLLATGVAWSQLSEFNKAERVKNTLALIREFNYDKVSPLGQPFTVLDAASHVANPVFIKLYATAKGIPELNRSQQDRTLVANAESYAVALHNFFDSAGDLVREKLLDENLFLSRLSLILVQVDVNGRIVFGAAVPANVDLTAYRKLVRAARDYRIKIGDTDTSLLNAVI